MGFYADKVLPCCINWAMNNKDMRECRQRVVTQLSGRVLEIGFGSGLNLPHVPDSVTHYEALDPALAGAKSVMLRLGQKRIDSVPFDVNILPWQGEDYPLPDNSVDCVLSTWTLCSIAEVHAALQEVRRILKPEGRFYFIEHGLSPLPATARWQNWLTPLQKCIGGGCHLNRDHASLLREAGFKLSQLDNFYLRGPRPYCYMYEGYAQQS